MGAATLAVINGLLLAPIGLGIVVWLRTGAPEIALALGPPVGGDRFAYCSLRRAPRTAHHS